VLGVTPDPIEVSPAVLIFGEWRYAVEVQRTHRCRSDDRALPLERAAEGYARMMSGKARFCVVLTMVAQDLGESCPEGGAAC
jgi:hypothetical protein